MRNTLPCPAATIGHFPRPATSLALLILLLFLTIGCSNQYLERSKSAAQTDEAAANDTPLLAYDSLAADADLLVVAFEFTGNQILVDNVYVNGQGPYRFMFDSGAQGAGRIDASLVEVLGLKQTREVRSSDTSNREGALLPVYRIERLKFGGLEYERLEFISRDYNTEQAVLKRGEIDGILGIDLFKDLLFTIDFPGREFRLRRGALPAANGDTILALAPYMPAPAIDVQLAGTSHRAFIDTGSMLGIFVPSKISKNIEFSSEPVVVGQARSGVGAFDIKMGAMIGDLVVGPQIVENPTIVIADGFSHIILGCSFFSEMVLEFDIQNNRMRIDNAP